MGVRLLLHRRFVTLTGIVSITATALLVFVFARLGLWQLGRAEEKVEMLAAHELAVSASPLQKLEQGMQVEKILYRNLEMTGQYDFSRQFLLDNKIHNKQAGYEIITPFYPDNSDRFLLVNRGWIGHAGDRTSVPTIPNATNETLVSGVITRPSKGFVLGSALAEIEQSWPLTLQYIDYATIADKVDKILLVSAVVVADQGQNGSLIYNWQPVANGPMKHYGYAFQWFAMLTAVLYLFFYFNFIKKNNE